MGVRSGHAVPFSTHAQRTPAEGPPRSRSARAHAARADQDAPPPPAAKLSARPQQHSSIIVTPSNHCHVQTCPPPRHPAGARSTRHRLTPTQSRIQLAASTCHAAARAPSAHQSLTPAPCASSLPSPHAVPPPPPPPPRARSARVPHAGGDAVDADQQRVAQLHVVGVQPQAPQDLHLQGTPRNTHRRRFTPRQDAPAACTPAQRRKRWREKLACPAGRARVNWRGAVRGGRPPARGRAGGPAPLTHPCAHLHDVDGVDVRVAHLDELGQRGVVLQQRLVPAHLQHRLQQAECGQSAASLGDRLGRGGNGSDLLRGLSRPRADRAPTRLPSQLQHSLNPGASPRRAP